jgi:hypothetical protein
VFVITILRTIKEVLWMLGLMAFEIFPSQPVVLFLFICRVAYAKQPKKFFFIANGWIFGGKYREVCWRGKGLRGVGRCGMGQSM